MLGRISEPGFARGKAGTDPGERGRGEFYWLFSSRLAVVVSASVVRGGTAEGLHVGLAGFRILITLGFFAVLTLLSFFRATAMHY